ncbi:PIN domain-containing protein [Candidatus Kaiserbacteria bacterium]|nr:PIN domain-containing protein [Candidatus Kaiserbacteria bacterium]
MLLDTNVLIGYINGDESIRSTVDVWRVARVPLIISSIVVAELLSYRYLTDKEIRDLELFVATFISVPFHNKLAMAAASLRRKYRFDIPDSGIIATAQVYEIPLVTRDEQMRKATEVSFVDI